MVNVVYTYLKRPYPLYSNPWQIVISSILFVVLVLVVFEPFHYRLDSIPQLWVLIHFILITTFGTAIPLIAFPRIFKKHYNPHRWTIGKSLVNSLLFILLLSIFVFLYDQVLLPGLYIEHTSISFLSEGYIRIILTDLLVALSIAVAPISFTFLFTQISILKRNLRDALELNMILSERIKSMPEKEDVTITLTGSTKEQLKIAIEKILYIEAADNYMDVYYVEENKVSHKLLRSTIKQIEEQLKSYPSFVRCHRAYIVNIDQITNIEGNAQGYKLKLQNTSKEIPVSRTYMQTLRDRIQ